MDKSILNPMALVYCERCRKEFPISRIYGNRRIDAGLPVLCYSCEKMLEERK